MDLNSSDYSVYCIRSLRYQAHNNMISRANKLKEMHQNAHGSYTEITSEKEVIRISV
jgi:hypothetical protein